MEDILKHFEKTDSINKVECKMCHKILISTRSFNLKTHLKTVHKLEIISNKNNLSRIGKHTHIVKARIEINKREVIRSYIGLVTENGVPFDLLNSENMRNLLKPICHALSLDGNKMFALNADNAKKILSNVVVELRNSIKNELSNNLFSIKIDSATRLERNIFGISVQYGKECVIISRMIGMVELKGAGASTGKNLALEIIKTLNKYDLTLNQVVAITSDNGANMIKTTSILSHCITKHDDDETYVDNDEYVKVLDEINGDVDLNIGEINICRCAAHTAQLVAIDVIKNYNVQSFVLQCRNLVKYLRKSSNGFRALFETNNLSLPRIDCPTRWGSTFRMIKDLQLVSALIENAITACDLDYNFWDKVDGLLIVFSPLNEILVKYQEEALNYGDFYCQWIKCKLLIQQIVQQSPEESVPKILGDSILKHIATRSEKLLANEVLKACLYIDPRFQHTLSDSEKKLAIAYLKRVWDRYVGLNKEYAVDSNQNESNNNVDDDDDILTAFLKQDLMEDESVVTNVHVKIETLKLPFLKSSTCVQKYWRERRSTDPELFILCNIVLSVPPTQVSQY